MSTATGQLVSLVGLLERADDKDQAREDPAFLISFMSAPDERRGDTFGFTHMRDGAGGWGWQRKFVEWIHGSRRALALKARQLGVTWIGCGYIVWRSLAYPGSLCLIYRQKEEEAFENVQRCWALLHSLPRWLWMDAEVIKPIKGALPSGEIRLRFPNGRISRIQAMTSASASGHGKTAAVVLLDEFSRIERATEIMKAVQPAAGAAGKIVIVSTANGVSNEETGEGNEFHRLWLNADDAGFDKRFLPWSLHPERDQHWYDTDPEVRGLRPYERAEQYPSTEDEAFTLTKRVFFSADDLAWYSKHRVKEPLFVGDWVDPKDTKRLAVGRQAVLKKRSAATSSKEKTVTPSGALRVYVRPVREHKYAVGADVATGDGLDYSAAYVVDLVTMEFVAEYRAKLAYDVYAGQLHFLGRWYNTARIAVETQGGYGDAVIAALRDGTAGRPAYPNLYRHRADMQPDRPERKRYGWPTNAATRPKILNQLERHVREHTLPYATHRLLGEMRTFIEDDKHSPSPRAQSGSHDDCVLAASIALEIYRQLGDFPDRERSKRRRSARPPVPYPWMSPA